MWGQPEVDSEDLHPTVVLPVGALWAPDEPTEDFLDALRDEASLAEPPLGPRPQPTDQRLWMVGGAAIALLGAAGIAATAVLSGALLAAAFLL